MEINLNDNMRQIIPILLLIVLPLLVLLLILIATPVQPWYNYMVLVTWFGMGIIFYSAIR